MMYTGFTGSKDGDIPQIMKWMYIMMLKYGGFVTNYSEERFLHDFDMGWRTVRYYTIKAHGRTLEVTIDDEIGIVDGQMSVDRDYNPIFELGSGSKPVGYIPGPAQIYYKSGG